MWYNSFLCLWSYLILFMFSIFCLSGSDDYLYRRRGGVLYLIFLPFYLEQSRRPRLSRLLYITFYYFIYYYHRIAVYVNHANALFYRPVNLCRDPRYIAYSASLMAPGRCVIGKWKLIINSIYANTIDVRYYKSCFLIVTRKIILDT